LSALNSSVSKTRQRTPFVKNSVKYKNPNRQANEEYKLIAPRSRLQRLDNLLIHLGCV